MNTFLLLPNNSEEQRIYSKRTYIKIIVFFFNKKENIEWDM